MSTENLKHTSSFDEKAPSEDLRVDVVQPDSVSLGVEERRLVRKIDWRIIPIICAVYLFAFLDRSNLGNARLQDLPQDTLHGDPTGVLFDWVNSAFFFSYIICQVPATLLAKLCPPRIWLGCAVVGWGLCSALMSTAFNFPGLMVARIGLGAFEACFAPGIPLYLSFFYTKEEIGKRLAFWFGFAGVAGAFGGLIAFGIQNVHAAITNWKLLFLIEGVPTVLFGLLAMVVLPNRPEETTMFNEKEREIALARMSRGYKADVGRNLIKSHIYSAFRDWRVYAGGVLYFGVNCAVASITAFLPTIITTFGFTNARAQLFTVPPYAVAVACLCMTAFVSDRRQSRGIFIAAASALVGIGYVLLLTFTSNNHVRYFATFCITSGTYTTIGITIAWFAHNLGSETKQATGTPIYQAIGQCGSVLGSHIYPSTEDPRYITGFAVTCALQFTGVLAAVILTISYRNDNKRRDQKYGKPVQDAPVDTLELADKAPMFRYVP